MSIRALQSLTCECVTLAVIILYIPCRYIFYVFLLLYPTSMIGMCFLGYLYRVAWKLRRSSYRHCFFLTRKNTKKPSQYTGKNKLFKQFFIFLACYQSYFISCHISFVVYYVISLVVYYMFYFVSRILYVIFRLSYIICHISCVVYYKSYFVCHLSRFVFHMPCHLSRVLFMVACRMFYAVVVLGKLRFFRHPVYE